MSTTQPSAPDPLRTVNKLADAMMWAVATIDAIERLEATYAAKIRVRVERLQHTSEGRRTVLMSSYLEVNSVWAANHLVSAYRRLSKATRERTPAEPDDMLKVVEKLRDVLEHWENNRGPDQTGAQKRLLEVDPAAAPWSSQWNLEEGLTLAGTLHIRSLDKWAKNVLEICEAESALVEKSV